MGGCGGQSLESVNPGEKRETGGPGQGVRCLWGTWKGYEGASSRSHTDWKGRAQGSLEGRQGPRKGGQTGGQSCIHVSTHGGIDLTVQPSPGHRL